MIVTVSFADVLPIWNQHVWPGRENIEPMSILRFLGGYDINIQSRYAPTFLADRDDHGTIRGVTSGHQTGGSLYRARTLFVLPEHRGQGIGRALLGAVETYAGIEGCSGIWAFPRHYMTGLYRKTGYHKVGDQEISDFGLNMYMVKKIGSPANLPESL